MDDLVTVAKIIKTRGIRGELSAELLTDFPERFDRLDRVTLVGPQGTFEERIEACWFHQGRVILKFAGRGRPDEVAELVGCEVRIPADERVELPEDTYFDSDLQGCSVEDGGRALGRVSGVHHVSGELSNLVVVTDDGREFMIPLVGDFIRLVDVGRRRIEVNLPPGLTGLAVSSVSRKKRRREHRPDGKA